MNHNNTARIIVANTCALVGACVIGAFWVSTAITLKTVQWVITGKFR